MYCIIEVPASQRNNVLPAIECVPHHHVAKQKRAEQASKFSERKLCHAHEIHQ
jgi:hypothetical protein